EPANAVILCAPADSRDFGSLRAKHPRLVHVPLREDWAQTLLLVAGESLRRSEAVRLARQAERLAKQNQNHATLGRYMLDMKHSVNTVLPPMLGNAEFFLLERGQLPAQPLAQIKTKHSMALQKNEVMQLSPPPANERKDAEPPPQAERKDTPTASLTRR